MYPLVPLIGKVNFKGGWDTLWNAFSDGGGPGVKVGLPALGVALIIIAVIMWLWAHYRRGQPAGKVVIVGLILGAVFAAPDVLIPILLFIVDLIINIFISIANIIKPGG